MDVDTIAAVSTAPGAGAIALVRISGPNALAVLQAIAPGVGPEVEPRRATLVSLVDREDGSTVDRAVATYFAAPASYTGEDMVELSCHGGWLVPEMVLELCVDAGARRADPGEFTQRAYLRGKLDLLQAEAIADLIEARSRALHRAAMTQLDRGLSERVSDLRERIVEVEALLAHHIDFPEEDDPPVPLDRVKAAAGDIVEAIDALVRTAPEGELLREGALAVFAGRPNTGKSSMYNALIGEARAIVTDQPGTTRDALEATVQLGGFPFRFVDTAGLREAPEEIEQLGIEVAERYLDRADLILYCVPAGDELTDADRAFLSGSRDVPLVLLRTMSDAASMGDREIEGGGAGAVGDRPRDDLGGARLRVSALSGDGMDQLRQLLPELAYSTLVAVGADSPVLTRERHARKLRMAGDEVAAFLRALDDGLPAEVASTHLRSAETALEELLGVVSVDDVLDVVFREFCVGK